MNVSSDSIKLISASGKGFSTSWSKDGRKFAVASEGDQETLRS